MNGTVPMRENSTHVQTRPQTQDVERGAASEKGPVTEEQAPCIPGLDATLWPVRSAAASLVPSSRLRRCVGALRRNSGPAGMTV